MQESTKIDEKGRMLVPSEIRKALGIESGSEVVVSCDPAGRKAVITPLFEKRVVELRIGMSDKAGSLARIAEFLAKNKFDIIMSESRSLEREKNAEWVVIGKYERDLSSLIKKLKGLKYVTGVKSQKR